VEVWEVPVDGLCKILLLEPPGLCVGKVFLQPPDSNDKDVEEVLGVLGENILCERMREISEYGGWRAYIGSQSLAAN